LSPSLGRKLADRVARRVCSRDPEAAFLLDSRTSSATELVDYLFLLPADETDPYETFNRLHWGGLAVYVSTDEAEVAATEQMYRHHPGFVVETATTSTLCGPAPLRWLGVGRRAWYFAARKTALLQPGQRTDRFTFDVSLTREHVEPDDPHGYAVLKQVPTYDNLLDRLIDKHPLADRSLLADRARKLVDKIFPIFLTREAGFLKLLQRDLPRPLRGRVPRLLHMEQDAHGFVRKLVMTWLRVGGKPITQLEFARQSATLLLALHEVVGIIHLDLRMDNIVITPRGVAFVDFGSAVRIGEDLSKNPMIHSLFDEMMSTSQIQRLLGRMKTTGKVTNQFICDAHGKMDKAADIFYLAMQMSKPHVNPDLAPFILYEADSLEAQRLSKLTDAILRPKDPKRPAFTSARDLLKGIERVARMSSSLSE
jgi:hypothetical protein